MVMNSKIRAIYYLMLIPNRLEIGNNYWHCKMNDRFAWHAMFKHVLRFCNSDGNIRLEIAKELLRELKEAK